MTYANTRLGSVPLQNDYGDVLVGTNDAATESDYAGRFRTFLQAANIQAVNTFWPGASGNTWSGGLRLRHRIDYFLAQPSGLKITHLQVL